MECEPSLALLLRRAERRAAARLGAVLAAHGGALEQWHVLSCLSDGVGRAMSEIGGAVVLPAPSMSKLIDGMVADNLVHRRVDERDRRRVLVFLTARGRRLHEVLRSAVDQDEAALEELHGADELAALRAGLAQLDISLDAGARGAAEVSAPR